jgi:predicted nucleic acid-binding protein
MKKQELVYIDSTIISYLFDQRTEILTHCQITNEWWNTQKGNYALCISDEVIAEIGRGSYPYREKAIETASKFYISNQLMPLKYSGDAVHLAYASLFHADYLLTWNCNHLANANKKQHIRIINNRLGIAVPEIITPLELFQEEA